MEGPNASLIFSYLEVSEQFGNIALVSRRCNRVVYARPAGVYRTFTVKHLQNNTAMRRYLALAEATDPRSHTRALKDLWLLLNEPQLSPFNTWESLAHLWGVGLKKMVVRAVSRKLRDEGVIVPSAFLDCVSADGDFSLYETVIKDYAHRVEPGLLAVRNVLAYCVPDIIGLVGPLFRCSHVSPESFRSFMAAAFNPAWLRAKQNRLIEIDKREVFLPAAKITLARRVRFVRNLLLCPDFCDLLDRFRQSAEFRKVEMPRLMRELLSIAEPNPEPSEAEERSGDASDAKEAKDDAKVSAAPNGTVALAGTGSDGAGDAALKALQVKFRNVAYAYYVYRFEQDAAWRDAFFPDQNYVETAKDIFLRGVYLQLLWLIDVHSTVLGISHQRAAIIGELHYAGVSLNRFPESKPAFLSLVRSIKKRLHFLSCDPRLHAYYDWAITTAWDYEKQCT